MDVSGFPTSTNIEDRRSSPSPFDLGMPSGSAPTPGGLIASNPKLAAAPPAPGYTGPRIPTNPAQIDIGKTMSGLGAPANNPIPEAPMGSNLPTGPAPAARQPVPPNAPGGPISPMPTAPVTPPTLTPQNPAGPPSVPSPSQLRGSQSAPTAATSPTTPSPAFTPPPATPPAPSVPDFSAPQAVQRPRADMPTSSLGMTSSMNYLESVRPKFGFL